MAVNQMVSPGGVGAVLKVPEAMVAAMKEHGITASLSVNKKMATFKTKAGQPFTYDFGTWQTGLLYVQTEESKFDPAKKLHQAGIMNTLNMAIKAAKAGLVGHGATPVVVPPAHMTPAVKKAFLKTGKIGPDGKPTNIAPPPSVKGYGLGEPNSVPTVAANVPTNPKPIAIGGYDASVVPQTLEEIQNVMAGPVVKLADATRQYQPVQGSGSGSKYFAVALGPDLKIGARWTNKKMSVRVEGPKMMEAFQLIQEAGFTDGKAGSHCSIHIAVPDDLIAKRALAALMAPLLMAYKFVTPLPVLTLIKNKGA